MVDTYEPVIRHIHNAVNLSDSMGDLQSFVSDMIKVAKVRPPTKKEEAGVPTVGDFVQLLKKHQYSLHKFLHQLCKNGMDLCKWLCSPLYELDSGQRIISVLILVMINCQRVLEIC